MAIFNGPNYSFRPIATLQVAAYDVQTALNTFRALFLSVGWTQVGTISGSGGTTGYELLSFPTPVLAQMRVSFFWNGTTTVFFGWPIIQIKVADALGTNTFTRNFLTIRSDAGLKTVRTVVNGYQFFIWYESTLSVGGTTYNTDSFNLNSAMGGCPVLKDPSKAASYWFVSGEQGDLFESVVPFSNTEYAFLYSGNFKSGTNNVATTIAPAFLSMRSSEMWDPTPFYSGNYPLITPIMTLGDTTNGIVCLSTWDSFIACRSYTARVTGFADFSNWENITRSSASSCVASFFVATTGANPSTQPGFSY